MEYEAVAICHLSCVLLLETTKERTNERTNYLTDRLIHLVTKELTWLRWSMASFSEAILAERISGAALKAAA